MILDSSAVIALVLQEPESDRIVRTLGAASSVGIGAPTLLETAIVLQNKLKANPRPLLAQLLEEAAAVVIPFGEDHWREAFEAFSRFGKSRHAAGLNFGDCMSYAVARLARQPLLCVGADFERTGLDLA